MRSRRARYACGRPLNSTVRRHTMNALGGPPKWVTLVGALGIFLILFVATYFAAAFLGGLVCGASARLYFPWTHFNCRYSSSILLMCVYFIYLFNAPALINALRTALAIAGHTQ